MAKAEKQKEKIGLNVDKAIDLFNSKQKKEEDKIDRYSLALEIESSYQNFVNYKAGRVPKIINDVKKIMDKTGISFNELITIIKD